MLSEKYGTVFRGCMTQIGDLPIGFESWEHVPNNPFFAPVVNVQAFEDYMDALRKSGDSCGARIRATPIAEAMLALVVMEHALRQRALCGDVVVVTPDVQARRRT